MIKAQSLSLIPGLEEITLRAGEQGGENVIRWPYVAENNDIGDWISGGELIFVTGLNWQWQTEDFIQLINLGKQKQASGLVILTNSPYIKSIPEQVLTLANQLSFPVFEQPYSLPMVKVTELLSNSIIKSDLAHQSTRALMEHLLTSSSPAEMTLIKAVEFGINTTGAFSIAMVVPKRLQKGDLSHCQFLLNKFLSDHQSEFPLLEYHQGWLLSLPSQLEQQEQSLTKWKALYKILNQQGVSCNIGVSEGQGLQQLRRAALQAIQTADFALYQETNHVFHYQDLGILQLFSGIEDYAQLNLFCQNNLGDLYNRFDKQSDLLKNTLSCYFKNLGSARQTAAALKIHRNTLTHRLKRIEILTGNNLSDVQQRLCLQNALAMERLILTKPI
ncbi:PucR family transcriptional regulator [Psychromonas sp. 14N.309.X.WAT.B.A12]|uniref:PucR family transcriptional regulator n=1 Tax=Psychromonas sp. 14N.309.X.WAT.B.A12 TaxID=2998322 RepID=UPI0025AEDE50|nr:PucR family transcriptional regulator [Psychromonas sp. 14N.309.X.WAT.B.A12]MDN2664494.1 PucR family transcriptional regulator [Psychromonas sp. 14N.309.X.WAT.B.A12]